MKKPSNRIVNRYQRVTFHGLGGVEAHGKRLGEDLMNVDSSRTHLNEFLVGHENLRDIANHHIMRMQKDNAARKAAGLRRRRHKSKARELEEAIEAAGDNPHALAEVIGWPWDNKNVHPFTEGIISVSHDWFLDGAGREDPAKVDAFREFVLGYLEEEFGDEVIYARFDRDEKTPHISFVIAPEHQNRQTKRRELSHRQHRLFGKEELQALFDNEDPDPRLTRRSYEILQDRIADYARLQGLNIERGERRAAKERIQRLEGETVIKRRNISPSRGRELAAIEVAGASNEKEAAKADRNAARRDRSEAADLRQKGAKLFKVAKASRSTTEHQRCVADRQFALLREREESMRIGSQAIISEELTYSPPTDLKAEGLTWGRKKPKSEKRRAWLAEKIKPAREWLVGFARSVFEFQTQQARIMAELKERAQAIVNAETARGRRTPQTMIDILCGPGEAASCVLEIPNAWAPPKEMTAEQIDKHLADMTNTAICDAYAPTRDARDFAAHSDMQARYQAGLENLQKEANRRGLNIEHREHRPDTGSDPARARLHLDSPPASIHVVRKENVPLRC